MTTTRCGTCGRDVRWYASKRTGAPILIGGKAYGRCGCRAVTWTRGASEVRRVEHGLDAAPGGEVVR